MVWYFEGTVRSKMKILASFTHPNIYILANNELEFCLYGFIKPLKPSPVFIPFHFMNMRSLDMLLNFSFLWSVEGLNEGMDMSVN